MTVSYDRKTYEMAMKLMRMGTTMREDLNRKERQAILLAVRNLTTGSAELARLLDEHRPLDVANPRPLDVGGG